LLTESSKRIEQQIKGIQDKAETVKTEVPYTHNVLRRVDSTDHRKDHSDSIRGPTVTTSSGSSMSGTDHKIKK
jgi:hypothetical protein